MNVNADFARRVLVHAKQLPWTPSPMPGVERRMLDRVGGEVARATSIVRYAPESCFSPHVHGGGEELLVLEGIFSDENGDYPVGSYLRNPPTSRHTPASRMSCTLFVKLWQFDPHDRTHVRLDTASLGFEAAIDRAGVEVKLLFADEREEVRIERWAPGTAVALSGHQGLEVLGLEGSFIVDNDELEAQSWLRLPKDASLEAIAGPLGCRVWMKVGSSAVR